MRNLDIKYPVSFKADLYERAMTEAKLQGITLAKFIRNTIIKELDFLEYAREEENERD